MQFFKIFDQAGFVTVWALQLQPVGATLQLRYTGCGSFSCYRAQDLRRVGFSSCGSQTLEHRLSSCGTRSQLLLTNQGLNLCLPYCQADCSPLSYQGSPVEVQLIYSVLISAIQQSDSLRHTHTHTHTHTYIYIILFHIFSIIVYHRILIQFSVL